MNPSNLKFAATHEWAGVNGDIATVGISDYAQLEIGDVVFVEMPSVGKKVNKGDSLGTIESYKTVSDLYAPVSGEVVEINESLSDSPQLINESAFDNGWIVKIKMSNPAEINELMDADKYNSEHETN